MIFLLQKRFHFINNSFVVADYFADTFFNDLRSLQKTNVYIVVELQGSKVVKLTSWPAFVLKNDGVEGVDGVLTVPTCGAFTTKGVVFDRSSFL
jgi:hypothetical protein